MPMPLLSLNNVLANTGEIFHDISRDAENRFLVLERTICATLAATRQNGAVVLARADRMILAAPPLATLRATRYDPSSVPRDDPRDRRPINLLPCSARLRSPSAQSRTIPWVSLASSLTFSEAGARMGFSQFGLRPRPASRMTVRDEPGQSSATSRVRVPDHRGANPERGRTAPGWLCRDVARTGSGGAR